MEEFTLRSRGWFGRTGKDGFIYRTWLKKQGIPAYELTGKPIIGICYLVGINALQFPLPGVGRISETGNIGSRWLSVGISGDVAGGNTNEANGYALPQSGKQACAAATGTAL
jgi:hypothetical protein